MRDPDKVRSGPICDTVAVIVLEESDDGEWYDTLMFAVGAILQKMHRPTSYTKCNHHTRLTLSLRHPSKSSRDPRVGTISRSHLLPSSSIKFWRRTRVQEGSLTSYRWVVWHEVFEITEVESQTWEEDEKTSNMKAVSIVLISQNFHPKAFKEILLEISNEIRTPDLTSSSELIRFLTEELVEEGSTIEIRTKTLNVELGFEMSPVLPVTGRDVTMLFKMLGRFPSYSIKLFNLSYFRVS